MSIDKPDNIEHWSEPTGWGPELYRDEGPADAAAFTIDRSQLATVAVRPERMDFVNHLIERREEGARMLLSLSYRDAALLVAIEALNAHRLHAYGQLVFEYLALRYPELALGYNAGSVFTAISELVGKGFVTQPEPIRQARGRPVNAYRLTPAATAILDLLARCPRD